MNVGDFAQAHGYALLALGLLFEGETAVLLASAAAHQGWLRLPAVFALAFGMAWMLDQTMFWLGRRRGAAMRLSSWCSRAASA